MTPALPDTLQELLTVALRDTEACKADPRYVFDTSCYHRGSYDDRPCYVGIVGAVMACSLGTETTRSMDPSDFPENLSRLLFALNGICFREWPYLFGPLPDWWLGLKYSCDEVFVRKVLDESVKRNFNPSARWVDDTLPNDLIGLLEVVIKDVKACEDDPKYALQPLFWHYPNKEGDLCLVCIAGAVMAQSLHCDFLTKRFPGCFSHRVQKKLEIINDLRQGTWDFSFGAEPEWWEELAATGKPETLNFDFIVNVLAKLKEVNHNPTFRI